MLSQTSSPSKDCEYIVDMFSKDSRTLHKPLILLLFMLLLLLLPRLLLSPLTCHSLAG